MVLDYDGEFRKQLELYKDSGFIGSHQMDISGACRALGQMVKQFFPVNEVPASIVISLSKLEQKFIFAETQLEETIDDIIDVLQDMQD